MMKELGLIWRELDFLTDLDKFLGPEQTGTAHFDDGKEAANRIEVCFWTISILNGISNI